MSICFALLHRQLCRQNSWDLRKTHTMGGSVKINRQLHFIVTCTESLWTIRYYEMQPMICVLPTLPQYLLFLRLYY